VFQRLLTAHPLGRIESEQLLQEIKRKRRSGRIERLEVDSRLDGQRADVAGVRFIDTMKVLAHSCALGDPTRRNVSSVGVPRKLRILLSWST